MSTTPIPTRKVITHLTHIEDFVVLKQYAGATEALTFVSDLVDHFGGTGQRALNVTVKIDGSPSLVVGHDPADGKFFVGTKGAFSKVPQLAKTPADIARLYADKGALADIMTVAFTALRPLSWPRILQGDVLFTPSIKRRQVIDGVPHVTFKPNTILYAVPEDTTFGQRIDAAQFGISFHTTYHGKSLDTLVAASGADIHRIPTHPGVVCVSNEYRDLTGTLTLTDGETTMLQRQVGLLRQQTARLASNRFLALLRTTPALQQELTLFQNALVRQGKSITLSPSTFGKQFVLFLVGRQQLLSRQKKTDRGIALLSDRYKAMAKAIAEFHTDVTAMIAWQQTVIRIKQALLHKLNTPGLLRTFYDSDEGLVAGAHEGFVAADSHGNFVKLVDRAYFSKINMSAHHRVP